MRLRTWFRSILPLVALSSGCGFADELWEHWREHHHPKPPDCEPEPDCDPSTHYVGADEQCIRKTERITVGINYSCAVLAGGSLKCWGASSNRVLGYGDTATRGDAPGEMGDALPFVQLGTGRTVVEAYADTDTTCAELDDGSVKCWGYSGYGTPSGTPVWDGQMGDALRIAPLPAGSVIGIGAGGGYGYALLASGALYRWGFDAQLSTFAAGSGMVAFARGSLYDAKHLCGLRDDGAVRCAAMYGPSVGEVGWPIAPVEPDGGYPPVLLGSGRTATAIALGDEHTCALLDDQTVKCWGGNQYGQLGYGDTQNRGLDTTMMGDALPIVPLTGAAIAITAGRHHTCALLEGGDVVCWGRNDQGQLGQGDTQHRGDAAGEVAALAPVPVGEAAVAIEAGTHTCAVLESGAVTCWGPNDLGQLGLGDTAARGDAPGEVAALPGIDLGE